MKCELIVEHGVDRTDRPIGKRSREDPKVERHRIGELRSYLGLHETWNMGLGNPLPLCHCRTNVGKVCTGCPMRFASEPLYTSHIPHRKGGRGRPWHWAKPKPWRSVGSCVRTELATANCTKAPGIGPPITRAGGDGRKIQHKPRSTVTLRRPYAYLRGLEPTE